MDFLTLNVSELVDWMATMLARLSSSDVLKAEANALGCAAIMPQPLDPGSMSSQIRAPVNRRTAVGPPT